MSVFPTLNQIGYVIRGGITYPARFLPEGRLKNAVRLRLLTFQNSCPKFLMANRGDIAIQVGTPKPSTMRQLSRYAGRRGRVVIIEADPGNAATLMGAMRSLRHQNVRIIPKGAWSSRTRLTLSRSPDPAAHKIAVAGINCYVPEDWGEFHDPRMDLFVDTIRALFCSGS